MTDQAKNDAALAAKDERIAELEAELAAANGKPGSTGDVRADAVAAQEANDALTPTPTQEELDRAKLRETAGGKSYKNRQVKA